MAGPRGFRVTVIRTTMDATVAKPMHPELLGTIAPDPRRSTMATYLTFATRMAGPLQDLTEPRPRLSIDAYPLERLLLLRCFGQVEHIEDATEIRNSGRELLYHARVGDARTLLLEGGGDEADIIASLAEQSAHLIPPIRWQRGEALVSLVLENGADSQSLLAQFPEARLVSKLQAASTPSLASHRTFPLLPPKLTEKQGRTPHAGHRAGGPD